MKQALFYSLKVWLITIVLAPVIVVFLQRNPARPFINYVKEYLWTVLGDLIFFIPPMLIFILVTIVIYRTPIPTLTKKLVILGLTLIFFLLSWWLLMYLSIQVNIFSDPQQMVIISVYLAAISLATLFYKLKSANTAANEAFSEI